MARRPGVAWAVFLWPAALHAQQPLTLANGDRLSGTKVYRGLGLRVELLDEYNSRPRPGIKRNHVLTTATLAYVIGG